LLQLLLMCLQFDRFGSIISSHFSQFPSRHKIYWISGIFLGLNGEFLRNIFCGFHGDFILRINEVLTWEFESPKLTFPGIEHNDCIAKHCNITKQYCARCIWV
jgi:hypothetical protein